MLHQLPPFLVPVAGGGIFKRFASKHRRSAWHTALLPLHHVTSMEKIVLFENINLGFWGIDDYLQEVGFRCSFRSDIELDYIIAE